VNSAEGGEPFGVVPAEVGVEAPVGVDAEVLTHDLDSQDFRVRELGGRTALAQLLLLKPIVQKAENGYDEGAKIHARDPLCVSSAAWNTTEHSGGLGLFSTFQRNLHTGLASLRRG
jgi:hypothetical protein